jgi:dihydrofolate reductase
LFGRVTYDLMASYWPTALADQHDPAVAAGMNSMSKVVFSRTMDHAAWSNTRVVKGDTIAEIRKMKAESGPDMAILGSGSIVAQLAPERVVDEYQMMVDPVALGKGRTMFNGLREKLTLKLIRPGRSRTVRSTCVTRPRRDPEDYFAPIFFSISEAFELPGSRSSDFW